MRRGTVPVIVYGSLRYGAEIAAGRPFFVMELVRDIWIKTYLFRRCTLAATFSRSAFRRMKPVASS